MERGEWSALIVNNPDRDFDLEYEIWCGEQDVAVVRPGGYKDGERHLELIVHACGEDLRIPVDWLHRLLTDAMKDLQRRETD